MVASPYHETASSLADATTLYRRDKEKNPAGSCRSFRNGSAPAFTASCNNYELGPFEIVKQTKRDGLEWVIVIVCPIAAPDSGNGTADDGWVRNLDRLVPLTVLHNWIRRDTAGSRSRAIIFSKRVEPVMRGLAFG